MRTKKSTFSYYVPSTHAHYIQYENVYCMYTSSRTIESVHSSGSADDSRCRAPFHQHRSHVTCIDIIRHNEIITSRSHITPRSCVTSRLHFASRLLLTLTSYSLYIETRCTEIRLYSIWGYLSDGLIAVSHGSPGRAVPPPLAQVLPVLGAVFSRGCAPIRGVQRRRRRRQRRRKKPEVTDTIAATAAW